MKDFLSLTTLTQIFIILSAAFFLQYFQYVKAPVSVFVTLSEKTDVYEYEVDVPQIPSLSESDPINKKLREDTENFVASFVKESKAGYEEMKKYNDTSMPSYVLQNVRVENDTDRFTALLVSGMQYGSGAAHPNHFTVSYLYDKKLRTLVALPDLFSDKNYLQVVSDFSKLSFKQRANENEENIPPYNSLFLEGFDPKVENYSVFVPTQNGLTFYFGEYQVASYAYGEQEVTIPYGILAPYINKDSALGSMVK